MRGTLTILGLYNYDTSIFENFVVPEDVDAATAINNIVMDNAELEIMYPEPDTMKFLIGLWSSRELPVWTRILNAITTEYNPLENYNRTETWTDSEEEDTTATQTGSNTRTPNLTETRTPNLNETHKVAGYNSGTLVDSTQDTTTGTDTAKTTGTDTIATSSSGSGSRDKSATRSGNVSGNIGVTTSQQMLNQELDVAGRTDIYRYISESFKRRFCLMVY